jgi:hypothetical protein
MAEWVPRPVVPRWRYGMLERETGLALGARRSAAHKKSATREVRPIEGRACGFGAGQARRVPSSCISIMKRLMKSR